MKTRTFLPIFVFLYGFYYAQEAPPAHGYILEHISKESKFTAAGLTGDMRAYNRVYLNHSTGNWEIPYENIEGSPYLQKNFIATKIDGTNATEDLRYNIYADQLEISKNSEIFVLPKSSTYTRFIFSPNEVIQYLETGDANSGYFIELVNGKSKLYKKLKINFLKPKEGKSGYEESRAAAFTQGTPEYYYQLSSQQPLKVVSQEEIFKAFPDKESTLKEYFKKNKTKFTKEQDLKNLIVFLNTL